jgi:hypothetical protein
MVRVNSSAPMAVEADYNNTSVCTIGALKIETLSYQGFQADVSEITRISAWGDPHPSARQTSCSRAGETSSISIPRKASTTRSLEGFSAHPTQTTHPPRVWQSDQLLLSLSRSTPITYHFPARIPGQHQTTSDLSDDGVAVVRRYLGSLGRNPRRALLST